MTTRGDVKENKLSLDQLNEILQCIGEGVIYQEADGAIKFFNQVAQRIFNITEDEAKRRTSIHPQWHLVYEDGSPCPGSEHPSMITLRTGQPLSGKILGIANPGQPVVWLSINTRPIFSPGQELPQAVVVSFNDITERKKAEGDLKESQARYRAIFETNQAPKLLLDPADGSILDANQAACQFYGYTLAEMKKLNIADINTLSPEAVLEEMEKAKQKDRLIFQFRHRLKSGEVRDVEVYSGPVQEQDRVLLHSIIIDITEQKRAEDALRWSERRFRTVAGESLLAIYETDANGDCVYVNDRWCEFAGLTPQEAIGQGWRRGLHPEDRERISALWYEHAKSYDPWNFEYRFLNPEGKVTWVLGTAIALRNEQGEITGYLGSNLDITDRKQAEEALRKSEESYRALVDGLPDIVMRFDREGRHLFVSPNVREVVDIEASAFIGKTHAELGFPESQCRFWEKSLRQVVDSGEALETEFAYEGKAGTVIFNWRLVPERDKRGRVSSVLSITRDITERKQSEEALAASEEKYRELVKHAPAGIYEIDLTERRFLSVNEVMCDYTGYSREEFLALDPMQLLTEDSRAVLTERLVKIAAGQEVPGTVEFHFKKKNGELIWTLLNVRIQRLESGRVVASVVAHNITERKRAEEALRDSQQLLTDTLESISEGFFSLDHNLVVTYFNLAASRLLGKKPEEVLGRPLFQAFPEAKGSIFEENYTEALREKKPLGFETYFGVPPYINWYEVWVYPQPRGISVFFQVTTERKRAEQALRESEERYRLIAEKTSDSIWAMDAEFNFTYLSPSSERLFGYTVEEWDNLEWSSFVHPDYMETVRGVFEGLRQEPEKDGTDAVARVRHKNGRDMWVEFTATPVTGSSGELTGVVGVTRDITSRQQAEEKLRQSLQTSADLVSAIPSGLFIYQFEPPDSLILLAGNPEAQRLTGISEEEFRGSEFNEIWPKAKEAGITDKYLEVMRTGETYETEDLHYQDNRLTGAYRIRAFPLPGERLAVAFEDVTSIRKAEVRLLEQEKVLTDILEDTLSGYWDWNLVDNTEYLSPAFKKMFGYEDHELPNSPEVWQRLIFPDDLPGVFEVFDRHVKSHGREPYYNEVRYRHKDGSTVWVICAGRVIEWTADGSPVRMVGCHVDITERKQAEEQIRKAHEKTQQYLEVVEAIIVALDPHGRVTLINRKGCQLLGHPEKEILGKNWFTEFLPQPQGMEVVYPAFLEVMKGNLEGVDYFENPVLTRTREQRMVAWHNTYLRGEQNEIIGTLSAGEDITERKLAEAALQERESFLKTLVESSLDAIITTDTKRKITSCNTAFLNLYGFQRNEVIGQPVSLMHASEASFNHWGSTVYPQLEREGFWRGEWVFQRKDGSQVPVELVMSAHKEPAGNIFGYVSVHRDITQRKKVEAEKAQLEAQLRQAQKMEAVGTLAGGIAHDFNNILGVVLGFAEIAYDDAIAGKTAAQDIKQIIIAAQRAKELVKQILTFSRKNEPALQPFSLNQACTKAQGILERTIPKMITIESNLAGKLPHISADPTQIEQVLLNLSSNAADAMPEGGSLVFATKAMKTDEEFHRLHPEVPPGEYVLLTVSDSGCGMDRETSEHIFEPFFTTKEVGKGTGLGLSTTYGIIKSHGGFIYCHSEIGKGTTFSIYLPVMAHQRSDNQLEAMEYDKAILSGTEIVLLVDDEEALRTIASRMLSSAGYRVLEASSGEEALRIFAAQPTPPDLVITDLGMPGMGGHKAMLELFARYPGIKVVIASGYAAQAQVKISLDAGAATFVTKPFKKNELLAKVRSVLDKQ